MDMHRGMKNDVKDLSAIILAGGYSTRMKGFKPLLPLGDVTIIESTINTFRKANIKEITVVIGYRAEELKILLDKIGVNWVYNEDYDKGMYSSVVAGVRSLPQTTRGFFLLPADMPLIKEKTMEELCGAYDSKENDIVYPTYKGQRGHPPLISANLVPIIKDWKGAGGLRALLSQYQNRAKHIEVIDADILRDIDTPEDYEELCKEYMRRNIKA